MKRHLLLAVTLTFACSVFAQETVKKGLNIGALPAVSFSPDEGFQYGAIVNLFNYGDGTRYPAFDQSFYLEASKYTKGSTVLRFYFDSDQLIKGIRTFVDLSYISEDMLDFYGFNGYQSVYSTSVVDGNRAFYKMSQKQLRLMADFKGKTPVKNLLWEASYNFVNYSNGSINYSKLNDGVDPTDANYLTPGESLYEKYVGWGIIRPEEADGGMLHAFKAGLVYDTRKVLTNPDRGSFSEALIEVAPSFLNDLPYARYSLMHRQYQKIVPDKLNLAVRVGIQGQIGSNEIPFFRRSVLMAPFASRSNPTGLGGANSVRGILRNRVVGNTYALANVELRWKVLNFRFINQNFYLGVNGFFDTGYILDGTDWNLDGVSAGDKAKYFDENATDGLHSGVGGGLKIAMNQNFVISADFGKALDARDGSGLGSYINLNCLF